MWDDFLILFIFLHCLNLFIMDIYLFHSNNKLSLKSKKGGGRAWVAQWVGPLPLAQVMVSGSWDQAPRWALCSVGSLLPPLSLPASLPTCDLSLSLSNK